MYSVLITLSGITGSAMMLNYFGEQRGDLFIQFAIFMNLRQALYQFS